MTARHNHWPPRRSLVIAAVVSSLIAECGSDGGSSPAPEQGLSAPSQASSAPSASEQDPRQAVEAAYTEFWPRTMHTDDKPEDTWHDAVAAVATDPQLTTTLNAMRSQKQAGIKLYGDVTVRIVSVDVTGDTAKVVDCQDASRTGQADAQTGDRKTVGVPRDPVTASLKRDASDGRWKVAQVSFPGGTC